MVGRFESPGVAETYRMEVPPRGVGLWSAPPMVTECWVNKYRVREETKNPHPPRRLPQTMGVPKRVAIPPSTDHRSLR